MQSVVKKCPNLFVFRGFAIPGNRFWLLCYRGDYKSPVFIGRTFFYGGFQIRRDGRIGGFLPLGVSTDLQSVVKKCPNLFVPGDLQSPVIGSGSFVIGGLQIPRFHRSNLFLRRILNPPGRDLLAVRVLFSVRRFDGFAIRR